MCRNGWKNYCNTRYCYTNPNSLRIHDLRNWCFKMYAHFCCVCTKILEVNKQDKTFTVKVSKCQHTVLWKIVQIVSLDWLNEVIKYVVSMGFYEKIHKCLCGERFWYVYNDTNLSETLYVLHFKVFITCIMTLWIDS